MGDSDMPANLEQYEQAAGREAGGEPSLLDAMDDDAEQSRGEVQATTELIVEVDLELTEAEKSQTRATAAMMTRTSRSRARRRRRRSAGDRARPWSRRRKRTRTLSDRWVMSCAF